MAITKEKKKEIISKLKNIFDDAKTIVFVNFHGLGVGDTTAIRKELRKNGISYFVAKKTLIGLVLKDKKMGSENTVFDGELGIVYGDDNIAPAREVYRFSKKHNDKLKILGGVFEKKFVNGEQMIELAQIPDMLALRGQFANVINSPIQRFVIALNQIAQNRWSEIIKT